MLLIKPAKVVQWSPATRAAFGCRRPAPAMCDIAPMLLSCRDMPMRSWATLLALTTCLCATGPVCGAEPAASVAPAEASAGATPAMVADWVKQLDDDRFAVRESAHYKLVAQGYPALAAVGQAAGGGSLESSTRAVSILLQWSHSDESVLSLGALERLAGLTSRPAEAAMAAERLAEVRETAALEQIVNLGGRVSFDPLGMQGAGPAPSLQVVIGPAWKGGSDGLAHIGDVRRASTISFHSAPIGEQAIPALTKLDQVQRIEFYGTSLAPEALDLLKRQLPKAVVEVRSGARLGIAGMPGPGGAAVQAVQSGSAAEKANLMPGDVITEISGVPVADFEALTREIAKAQPGDTVALKVLRQGAPAGQPIDISVTFDQWGAEPPPNPATALPTELNPFGALPQRVLINRR